MIKYIKKAIVVLTFLGCYMLTYAQQTSLSATVLLEKVRQSYDKEKVYSFNVRYELFNNPTATVPEEFYTGRIIRNGNQNYSKINNTEFIQFANAYLKINHDEKAILYANSPASEIKNITDLTSFLSYLKTSNVKQEGNTYVCELIAKEVTALPFSKMELYIDAKNFKIKKQVSYLFQQSTFKDKNGVETMSNRRLELTFSNFSKTVGEIDKVFRLNNYVTVSANTINPSKTLEAYELYNASKN